MVDMLHYFVAFTTEDLFKRNHLSVFIMKRESVALYCISTLQQG